MMKAQNKSSTPLSITKITGLILGPLSFLLIILFFDLKPDQPTVTYGLAVSVLMAVWWITEAIPLAVTSLLPLVLYPLFGIMNGKDVSSEYFNHVIFLFIGGFIVALTMQKWGLHKRIALKILMFTGVSPARILFGFMFATAFLSMWMSNTATTMMMIPILISIIQKLEENTGKPAIQKYAVGLLLGVAYSASIGGIATLIGSPPNLMFTRIFDVFYTNAPEISFMDWMLFAAPVSIVLFFITLFYLYFLFKPDKRAFSNIDKHTFKKQYRELGKMTFEEKVILGAFIGLAFLWMFRNDIATGGFTIPGWSGIFNNPDFINDGTVAIFVAIVLFLIPSKSAKGKMIMDWKTARSLPWGIVLLFGGGFALASGIKASGLSGWIEVQLSGLERLSPFYIILLVACLMTFLTEITSNTATTGMILPILAALGASMSKNPLLFMLPATLSASMAFMLPVATPPNAIIFGTGRLKILDMAKTGFFLNLIGIMVITLATYAIATHVFHIDLHHLPEWISVPNGQ